jgi:hypothetical protein
LIGEWLEFPRRYATPRPHTDSCTTPCRITAWQTCNNIIICQL